jgi:hypothetical protein
MSFTIFTPTGTTKNLAVTASTGRVALPVFANQSRSVRVFNSGSVVVFIEFGTVATDAAVATSMPIGPGATEWFEIGGAVTYVAGITASGTATVYFTEGMGS